MINYIKGSVFDIPCDAIFHVSNAFCTMGSGLALQIKERYPEAYEADLETKKGDKSKLGSFSHAIGNDGKHIYNCYGQYTFGKGRQLNYEAFYSAFELAIKNADSRNLMVINTAWKIGADRAGGDWRIIERMIEVIMESYPSLTLNICKYQPLKEVRNY